jgi:rhodanese-related sulfurtransferase
MSPVKSLRPSELERFKGEIAEGRCILVDVRERREFEAGHMPMAQTRPLSQMDQWQGEMPRERTLILYCRAGHRSRRCADLLSAMGFSDVYTLEGGFNAWSSLPSSK